MTNQRTRIALDEGEQRALLEQARTMYVASLNADGRPHLVPMWFALDDDGVIAFTTYGVSQKVRNLERDARITVLVETGTAYEELRGVVIDGDAEIVRDPHVTIRTRALIAAKQAGAPRPAPVSDPAAPLPSWASRRVTVRVHPRRVRSWDHRKLG
jgi:PPOX class probable F420-dependent enzyme